MSILEKINCSNDIKQLNTEELPRLCEEIRSYLIQTLSKTGGHLASNLGTVELTVALHRVYDTSQDRIVFDVGHQSYTHKIITGRRDALPTIRQFGGISGFPKPHEAKDDAFIAGHASNSVSVALGMAHARTLSGENYDVCAVIGDGAMTGGLSFEGLSNTAMSGEPIVVILNDNNMSIAENVGGTAKMLQSMRVKPAYLNFKRQYRKVFSHLPALYSFNHRVKEWLKAHLIPDDIFTEMGFCYLGPIDGHDLRTLESVIRWARDMREPVIVHVLTKKGKGCAYAEANPELYHGVGPFDAQTGVLKEEGESFAACFGKSLCRYAEGDQKIAAITAAMSGVPVFAVYSSFLQRSFDMLIHDISLQHLHAVFAVDRAGLVGRDGETHQGVFDIAYLSVVPDMTIYCPASFAELDSMLGLALYACDGPVAVRYPRGGEGAYRDCHNEAECVLREGKDLTIVSYGIMINEVLSAAEKLAEAGICSTVIKLGRIRPNGFQQVLESLSETQRLIVAEDVCAFGSIGSQILSAAAGRGLSFSYRLLNLADGIVTHGSVEELRHLCGIDAEGIEKAARELTGRE